MTRGGFTLVEFLVALLVFALLSAAGVTVMRLAVDNQEVVRGRMDRVAELQRARVLLKADLSQAAARRVRAPDGAPADAAFYGVANGGSGPLIALVRRGRGNPDGEPRASLQYVEYRLIDDRLERRARHALDGAPVGEPQTVLGGVRALRAEYLGAGGWSPAFQPTLDAPLPQAVRLHLDLDGFGRVVSTFLAPGGAT
jgi:general secretion pathway protein J